VRASRRSFLASLPLLFSAAKAVAASTPSKPAPAAPTHPELKPYMQTQRTVFIGWDDIEVAEWKERK